MSRCLWQKLGHSVTKKLDHNNKKLDTERFSPNIKYEILESSIKKELCSDFKFMIKRNREEIRAVENIQYRQSFQLYYGRYNDYIPFNYDEEKKG